MIVEKYLWIYMTITNSIECHFKNCIVSLRNYL